ncbi:hypothetical protein JMF89_04110 [Clostridiaceae bacterium UIB06]|uniref:Uncharacterized protein n=1 Tax=Clostridium thailandense TaxID=2794346 RepID=A0A949TLR6_9CLOT|nr:hypothetical protein [Clostridium thailandense]MBV7271632.1 hypothetical protein [Clostridium thailandense]MCH5136398.1 hypothetical protein [Clostridiaceae bacterium UIB06]
MVLEFIQPYLNGNAWESLCDSCYRIRYQEYGYTQIPAAVCGDGGIEGFTSSGIVYQCYCPEREYSDNELYEHMRNKMTRDINKLLKPDYADTLKGLGIHNVCEWHFVIPEYKDKRIIEHMEKKRKEVLEYKKLNSEQCNFISDEFKILVKVAEDFKVELARLIRTSMDAKLDLTVLRNKKGDWSKCDSEKVSNVKRKVRAVMNNIDEEDEDFKEVVDTYMKSYVIGIELMEKLRVSQNDIYEQILSIEQAYKKEVSIKTKMNTDSSLNSKLFNEIISDFQKTLEQEFDYLTKTSIMELKMDLVSSWLADCSMQFKCR